MHNRALHNHNGSYLVVRPTSAVLRDVVTSLATLRCPKREGFYPAAGTTHIARFLVDKNSPLGPLTYGTGVSLLACYTARFSDGKLGVVLLSGSSMADICRNGTLRGEMAKLHSYTTHGHRVIQHSLTTVRTPEPTEPLESHRRFYETSLLMPTIFKYPFREGDEGLPRLTLRPVILRGWKESSPRLPECTFSSISCSEHLELTVSWGTRLSEQVAINLTEPLATFVPLMR
jgi:hypothetical protein